MSLNGHYQNAYVTHDLDRAADLVGPSFGIGEFKMFEPAIHRSLWPVDNLAWHTSKVHGACFAPTFTAQQSLPGAEKVP